MVALVTAADVCLMPHVDNALTRAMSPLKLYEYLAGGAPVAALDLAPIRDVSPRVVIREDLGRGDRSGLGPGASSRADRRAFAEANSWKSRQEPILQLALETAPTRPVAA